MVIILDNVHEKNEYDLASDTTLEATAIKSAPGDKVWLDYSAYPHIVDAIIGYSDEPELKVFSRVSRACRKTVDELLNTHLILSGHVYADGWRRHASAALHNRLWALARDYQTYYTDPANVREFKRPSVDEDVPIHEFARTRVLDIQGKVRRTVIERFAHRMPNLHTIRVYTMPLGNFLGFLTDTYISDTKFTTMCQTQPAHNEGESASDGDIAEAQMRETILPVPPSVRRVVNFTTIIPVHQKIACIAPLYVCPTAEELVVNVTYNPALDCVCHFFKYGEPLQSLKRATIIFTPSEETILHDYLRQQTSPNKFLEPFAEALVHLGAPATIVGLEEVAQSPKLVQGKTYDDLVEYLDRATIEAITFVSLSEYRASLDVDTWNLFTRQEEVRNMVVDEMIWGTLDSTLLDEIRADWAARNSNPPPAYQLDTSSQESWHSGRKATFGKRIRTLWRRVTCRGEP